MPLYFYKNKTFSHNININPTRLWIPFIVIIETIRNVIRPRTLVVRLTANIIAGHLLITLLGNTGPIIPSIIIGLLITVLILLLILESAVAIIQSNSNTKLVGYKVKCLQPVFQS